MWFGLIVGLTIVGIVHARMRSRGVPGRWAEMALVYILVVACGIAQILLGVEALRSPERLAAHLWLPAPNGMEIWTAASLIGGGIASVLAIWLRGTYLIGPVVMWSTFFLGATYAHLRVMHAAGHHLHAFDVIHVFASHGLISLLLVALWLFSRRSL